MNAGALTLIGLAAALALAVWRHGTRAVEKARAASPAARGATIRASACRSRSSPPLSSAG